MRVDKQIICVPAESTQNTTYICISSVAEVNTEDRRQEAKCHWLCTVYTDLQSFTSGFFL